ncbi:hypothetical protein WBG99_18850 [Streptomyces sp. TG1A-60]|uniref:hypothetical protein n=1 Tax=Streptomyces sp. TG1A-60 TaxID=3129111 RepID=UPI0030D2C13C
MPESGHTCQKPFKGLTEQHEPPRTIAWCSWHSGLSDTARPVRISLDGRVFACERCRQANNLTPLTEADSKLLPEPPPVMGLTWAQTAGWACCFCGEAIRADAVSIGRAQGHMGAHDLSAEVYACSACARPGTLIPESDQPGGSQ